MASKEDKLTLREQLIYQYFRENPITDLYSPPEKLREKITSQLLSKSPRRLNDHRTKIIIRWADKEDRLKTVKYLDQVVLNRTLSLDDTLKLDKCNVSSVAESRFFSALNSVLSRFVQCFTKMKKEGEEALFYTSSEFASIVKSLPKDVSERMYQKRYSPTNHSVYELTIESVAAYLAVWSGGARNIVVYLTNKEKVEIKYLWVI